MTLPPPPEDPAERNEPKVPSPEQKPHPAQGDDPKGRPPPGPYGLPQGVRPPQKSSKTWVIVLIIVIVLLLICGIGAVIYTANRHDGGGTDYGSGSGDGSRDPAQPYDGPAEPRDGTFAFQVTAVDRGVTRIGAGASAKGVFTVISLSVSNVGDARQSFTDEDQVMVDNAGRQYPPDPTADLDLNKDRALPSDVDPGQAIRVRLAFDVPDGTKADRVELHDSTYSDGILVHLP